MGEKSTSLTIPTPEEFWAWAGQVPVASRDTGLGPITPWGTQRELIRQVLGGLREGVHQFLVTKSGQVGSSISCNLLSVYWMRHFAGMQGMCVANADDVRDFFRDTLTQMTLAVSDETERPRINNKDMMTWPNGSRLILQTAGPRTGAYVAVGRGFAFAHGTEVALWQNPTAMTILRTRFSDRHPQRLAIFETTPRGRNWWWEVWQEAKRAKDIRRIELAWWMREDYALDPQSALFKRYWDGRLTTRERHWLKEVKRRHGHELRPEQFAWRRFYVSEKAGGDERTADQEAATLIEEGFEATGISFLSDEPILHLRRSVAQAPKATRYRYVWGPRIESTDVRRTAPAQASLTVWEEPQLAHGYVVSAVPAFSTTPECPDWVVTVWRASRDRLDQVAEFAEQAEMGLQRFSWVCIHLVTAYRSPRRAFMLETIGVGQGVLEELKRLQASGWGTAQREQVTRLAGPINHYLWRRPDSMAGGVSRQWRSSPEYLSAVMTRLRDQLTAGTVLVRSPALLAELERVRQDGNEFIPEGREPSNHRVVSAALAVESWASQLRPLFRQVQGAAPEAATVVERMVGGFFNRLREPARVIAP
jgi:hypothetical protein